MKCLCSNLKAILLWVSIGIIGIPLLVFSLLFIMPIARLFSCRGFNDICDDFYNPILRKIFQKETK